MSTYTPLVPGTTFAHQRYTIVRMLATGGMGAIYLATDHATFDRTVVVKALLDYYDAADPEQAALAHARFVHEARTLATLNHPAIPHIIDSFQDAQHKYLVMEYIVGHDLTQYLTHRHDSAGNGAMGAPYPLADVLRWGTELCNVLTYLHSRQPEPVVHHDIKPANILVEDGMAHVWLVDFGTAKARLFAHPGGATGLQQSSVYGTHGYAAPEQYYGQSVPRSDVYALAATLYHLATDDDPREHPLAFPQLDALGALGMVLRQALAQDSDQRPTAVVLGQQLCALLEGDTSGTQAAPAAEQEPARVRPLTPAPTPRSASVRWYVAVLVIGVVLVGGLGLWRAFGGTLPPPDVDTFPVVAFTPVVPPTPSPLTGGGVPAPPPTPRPTLTPVPEVAPHAALHSFASITAPDTNFSSIALSPHGDLLAIGGFKQVTLWTVADQQQLRVLQSDTNIVDALAFSPDGTLLLSTSNEEVHLWDVQQGTLLWTVTLDASQIASLAFSPDGQTIVTAGGDNTARVLRTHDGTTLHTLLGHGGDIRAVAFRPDGQLIATGSHLGVIELWQANDGHLLRTIRGFVGTSITTLAFQPDGSAFVTGSETQQIHKPLLVLWQTADGTVLHIFPEERDITSVAFHPDGQRFAAANAQQGMQIWRVRDGALLYTLNGHQDSVNRLTWSADGTVFASSDNAGVVLLWHDQVSAR